MRSVDVVKAASNEGFCLDETVYDVEAEGHVADE